MGMQQHKPPCLSSGIILLMYDTIHNNMPSKNNNSIVCYDCTNGFLTGKRFAIKLGNGYTFMTLFH